MKVSSDVNKKIVGLQQEIKNLKTSQILGGDNSRAYRHYYTGKSAPFYYRDGMWLRYSDYIDPDYIPVPGGVYSMTSVLYPLDDDPFALVGIEKLEVWRGGNLLTWGAYQKIGTSSFGQKSQYGDSLLVMYEKISNGYSSATEPKLGTRVTFQVSPAFMTSSQSSPFQYEYRIWLKTTSLSDYGWIEDTGVL